MLLGRGVKDERGGVEVPVIMGDVIVLPAGTTHCNVESTDDYRYIGVYPKVHGSHLTIPIFMAFVYIMISNRTIGSTEMD